MSIPRKVVAGYSLIYPNLDVIHYRIDDQGSVWSRNTSHRTWHEEQPLPPRDDAVDGEISNVEVLNGLLKASNALIQKLQASIEERERQCEALRSDVSRLKAMHDPSVMS